MRLAILLPQKGRRRPEHPQTASQTTSTRIFERPDGPLTAPSSVEVPPTTAHFNLPVDLGLITLIWFCASPKSGRVELHLKRRHSVLFLEPVT